jgi:hypothetical protein
MSETARIVELDDKTQAEMGGYSNFDHTFEDGTVAALADGSHYVAHAAWDHWGKIHLLNEGVYEEEVWRYNAPVEKLQASSLEELVSLVNDEYGHD